MARSTRTLSRSSVRTRTNLRQERQTRAVGSLESVVRYAASPVVVDDWPDGADRDVSKGSSSSAPGEASGVWPNEVLGDLKLLLRELPDELEVNLERVWRIDERRF